MQPRNDALREQLRAWVSDPPDWAKVALGVAAGAIGLWIGTLLVW